MLRRSLNAISPARSVQIVEKVGSDGDREKKAIRDWLGSPGTSAKSQTSKELLERVGTWTSTNVDGWESLTITPAIQTRSWHRR
jgi:hypothetical protein